jgi:hypothetical protein
MGVWPGPAGTFQPMFPPLFGNGSLLTEVVEKILYCQPGPEPSVFCDFFLELSKLLSFFSEFLRATLYKRDPTLSVGVNHRDSRIQSAAPYDCSLDVSNKIGRKYVAPPAVGTIREGPKACSAWPE